MFQSYKNQSIKFYRRSIDLFLYSNTIGLKLGKFDRSCYDQPKYTKEIWFQFFSCHFVML